MPCARKFLNPFRQRADSSPGALRFPDGGLPLSDRNMVSWFLSCRLKTTDSITHTAGLRAQFCRRYVSTLDADPQGLRCHQSDARSDDEGDEGIWGAMGG